MNEYSYVVYVVWACILFHSYTGIGTLSGVQYGIE